MLQVVMILAASLSTPAEQGQPDNQERPLHSRALGVEFAVGESKVRRSIIPTRTPYGFLVKQVEKNSAAAKANWRVGDVILEWDGQPLRDLDALDTSLQQLQLGATVKFRLARYKPNRTILTRQPWEYHEGTVAVNEVKK